MKIAINLFLASPKSVTGAFVYIQDILPALFKIDKNHTYYLLGHAETISYFKKYYGDFPSVRYQVFDIRHDVYTNPIRAIRKLLAKLNHNDNLREAIYTEEVRNFLKKERIDIYFSPSQTIYPRGLDSVKHVTTILDLQFEYFPENYKASYLKQRREDGRYAVEKSSKLIAISEYTKKTLIEKYNAQEEKIKVIYFAPHEIEETPANIELPEEFVFYPAAIWKHKNHRILIEAMGLLKDKFPRLHAVCAGLSKSESLKQELTALAESLNIKERIFFPGYMAGGNLRLIYEKAKALAFPSAFEGFGIPLVEAMQFGLPIVAANNTSITEVVEHAGILVPTGNALELAKALEEVLTDKNLRKDLINKGLFRANKFSWQKAAEETLELFEKG